MCISHKGDKSRKSREGDIDRSTRWNGGREEGKGQNIVLPITAKKGRDENSGERRQRNKKIREEERD